MIARTWLGRTKATDYDLYYEYLVQTGLGDLAGTPGNQGVQVFRRLAGETAEFWVISLWESFEAIERFSGPDRERAVYYPEDRKFLLELSPTVTHYEVLRPGRPS